MVGRRYVQYSGCDAFLQVYSFSSLSQQCNTCITADLHVSAQLVSDLHRQYVVLSCHCMHAEKRRRGYQHYRYCQPSAAAAAAAASGHSASAAAAAASGGEHIMLQTVQPFTHAALQVFFMITVLPEGQLLSELHCSLTCRCMTGCSYPDGHHPALNSDLVSVLCCRGLLQWLLLPCGCCCSCCGWWRFCCSCRKLFRLRTIMLMFQHARYDVLRLSRRTGAHL